MNLQNEYEKNGFIVGSIPKSLTKKFIKYLDVAESHPANIYHINEGFFRWQCKGPPAKKDMNLAAAKEYSEYNTQYEFDTPKGRSILTKILNCLQPHVQEAFNSPWKCVNVRIWKTVPNKSSFGPQDPHRDQFPRGIGKYRDHVEFGKRYITKVMLYLTAPSLQGGTTEIISGNINEGEESPWFAVTGEEGTWLLFDNNLLHRGVAPTTDFRVVCELTVEKTVSEAPMEPVFAGFGATW